MKTLPQRFVSEKPILEGYPKVRWLRTVKRPINKTDGLGGLGPERSTEIKQRKGTEWDLRRQGAELAHAARISMMGELAASLAHELNQPLTAILSNAQAALRFMAANPPDLEEVRDILKEIVQDNSRASEIIRHIRALVKKEDIEFAAVDLASVVSDVMTFVRSDAVLHSVQIAFEASPDLPRVRGDRVQLQQVILNLLLNAFDALKDCREQDRRVLLQVERESARAVKVMVRDCGTGLNTDSFDNLFQPFFTTKRDGLGMGLSICRSIVQAHGGRMWAENDPGYGATFCFTVPVEKRDEG